MINLAMRTEYSFRSTYGWLNEMVERHKTHSSVGIADLHNTFGHIYLREKCDELGIKPIYGIRFAVFKDVDEKVKHGGEEYILFAKNNNGLIEINKLVGSANENFYYIPRVRLVDIWGLSENVIVVSPQFSIPERVDYVAIANNTFPSCLKHGLPHVAINNNDYFNADDKETYQLFLGKRLTNRATYPQHLLSEKEWMSEFDDKKAVRNTYEIAENCNCKIVQAPMIKYLGDNRLRTICRKGAREKNIDLSDKVYKERLNTELRLIRDRDFTDYFLIVSELVLHSKKSMLVGPGRGSSGGSLVCFLCGITEVDPIRHDLLFERFIDVNRKDLPDIDIDFPDEKRAYVIKWIENKYGKDNVTGIANISSGKHRGIIGEFAKGLEIDEDEVEQLKSSIIGVSSGDVRYWFFKNKNLLYTFDETDVGKSFIERHPNMEYAIRAEGHTRHSGKHAAGVIISPEKTHHFGGINPRDNTVQLDGKMAEKIGLLKIDCLGLSTLSVLEEVAKLSGFDFHDYYSLPLDDDRVFSLFRNAKLKSVFQFEGHALSNLCNGIVVRHFEDIVAITALARPGPLHSGGAAEFAKIHSGKKEKESILDSPIMENITKKTHGVIVYQEQVMRITREIANMEWSKVGAVRKAMSKKDKKVLQDLGEAFIAGSVKNGFSKEQSKVAWDKILKFGQYGFNRSHALAYAMVSYWTAWAKRYHPMSFLVANLNHPKSHMSSLRLIREMMKTHKNKFLLIPYDKEKSMDRWIMDGKEIIGPLTNINGIGIKNAQVIMRKRKTGEKYAVGITEKLKIHKTKFDIIFPCHEYWGRLFSHHKKYGLYMRPSTIESIRKKGEYIVVAQLIKKNVRDLNEASNVIKRGGELYSENTKLLNITVEDDTGSLMCRVSRYEYEKLGKEIAEDGEEEVDWYLIKGKITSPEIIFLFINEIHKLGDGYSEKQTIRDI